MSARPAERFDLDAWRVRMIEAGWMDARTLQPLTTEERRARDTADASARAAALRDVLDMADLDERPSEPVRRLQALAKRGSLAEFIAQAERILEELGPLADEDEHDEEGTE